MYLTVFLIYVKLNIFVYIYFFGEYDLAFVYFKMIEATLLLALD